jgi:hypothetical protein
MSGMSESHPLDYGTTPRRSRWVVLGLILIVPLLAAIFAATVVRPVPLRPTTVPAQQRILPGAK